MKKIKEGELIAKQLLLLMITLYVVQHLVIPEVRDFIKNIMINY